MQSSPATILFLSQLDPHGVGIKAGIRAGIRLTFPNEQVCVDS